jgi:hypothetical protein
MDDQLRDLFYSDTLLGLATPKQLALAARESGLALTQAEARDFIRKPQGVRRKACHFFPWLEVCRLLLGRDQAR